MPGGRPIPTGGFPSQSAAVLAWHAMGKSGREIAAEFGLPITRVTALIAHHRCRGRVIRTRTVRISVSTWDRLAAEAFDRGVNVDDFVEQLLGIVVEDGLMEAILDDVGDDV